MATFHYFTSSILIIYLFSSLICYSNGDVAPNPCNAFKNCSACITSNNLCSWCEQKEYMNGKEYIPRCDLFSQLLFRGCDLDNIINVRSNITSIRNDTLSDVGDDDAVQIKPQRIKLQLRPHEPISLKVDFRQAEDYPVDLYYLMDLSNSMEDDKAKLAELGDLLAKRMQNITRDFRLGFGSFVDKVVMPFVSTVPSKLDKPCDQRDGTACAKPYGFRNHMPLDLNTSRFSGEVNAAKVSGNLDAPEGGFDAIMQAIVCNNKIGWREQSRKLLVFSTDAGFHYAGDGKLGGIVTPNDGHCYLNSEGYYEKSTVMDYPSLSQINQKMQEKKVNTIFAVTADQLPIYESLSKHVEGSIFAHLENDSSNIVELIKNQYEKITSKVELTDASASSNVKIQYESKCLGDKTKVTNTCEGLKVGSTVSFTVTFSIDTCPKNPKDRNHNIVISPVGLKEDLFIEVELLCQCDCEKEGRRQPNSDYCTHGNGTYECGICNCNKNKYGLLCQCDTESLDEKDYDNNCTKPNTTLTCSGKGKCRCGTCICEERTPPEQLWGQYCECDNFSCDRHKNLICGGNGVCECNKCICNDNYTGSACECPKTKEGCLSKNGKICNDQGECICGACVCFTNTTDKYSGPKCEECPTCSDKCSDYKACVQCLGFQSGPLAKENCTKLAACNFTFERIDEIDESDKTKQICKFKDEEDDCIFRFAYFVNDTVNYVELENTKSCPEPVDILAIILIVIGAIVAIGLALLLIWKLFTTIHDRREFAKFEKERQNAKWDTGENPIYKQATSTFKNPTYGGKH